MSKLVEAWIWCLIEFPSQHEIIDPGGIRANGQIRVYLPVGGPGEVRVRYAETDAAGIVYYSNFFVYFEVGKMDMFRELNLPYDLRLPMVEAHCDYKKPVRFDDILEIHTSFSELYPKGFKIDSKVYLKYGKNKTIVAEGYTKHLTTDMHRRVCKVPKIFLKAFGSEFDK